MAGELAVGYITLIPSTKGIVAGIEKELGIPLAAAGTAAGVKTGDSFKKAFTAGLKNLAVPVGLVAGLAGIGLEFQKSFATIARGTGATGATLDSLDKSFSTVLRSGAGSMSQVATAITGVYQRTKLTGSALDDFARKEVALARITKTDVGENVQSTTALFKLFGVAAADQSNGLDLLFRASQVAGVSVTQLSQDMQTAAPTAKILGLSIDQTASLVANLDAAGLPASKVMLGLASAFAKAAKAGKDPLSVIHDLTEEIKKAPTATDAATIATAKFGISARQAATLVAGLRSGAIDLTKTLDGGLGILQTAQQTQTLSDRFSHLKNVALVGLEPLATKTLGAITTGVQDLIPVIGFLGDHMDQLGPIIATLTAGFAAFKVAVGVEKLIQAANLGFVALKASLLDTAAAQGVETGAATETTVALEGETVAATEAATATKAVGLSTAGMASLVTTGAIATFFLGKTLYDLAAVSTKASVNVKGSTDVFAQSLLGNARTAQAAKTAIDGLGDATKRYFSLSNQGAASEQTGGSILTNLGVSYDRVTAAVTGGRGAIDKFVASLHLNQVNADTLSGGLHKLRDSLEASAKQTLAHLVATKAISQAQSDQALSSASATAGFNDYIGALKILGQQSATVTAQEGATTLQLQLQKGAWTNLTTAIIGNTLALQSRQEGTLGVIAASLSAQQATLGIADAQKQYNDALKSGDTHKIALALVNLQQAQVGATQATFAGRDAAEQAALSASGLDTALKAQTAAQKKYGDGSPQVIAATQAVAEKQKLYRQTLVDLAAETSGPVHDAIETFLHQTANIPPKKATAISTPGLQTAITNADRLHHEYDLLPKSVNTTVSVLLSDASKGNLDAIRQVLNLMPSAISLQGQIAAGGKFASGGFVAPGRMVTVGEDGTEGLMTLPGGGAWVTKHTDFVAPTAQIATHFDQVHISDPSRALAPETRTITFPHATIQSWNDRDLALELEKRIRLAETLAGVGW